MIPLKNVLNSTLGRKFIMGLSGLALVGFIITHLLGNLPLYLPEGTAFNTYVQTLHSYGDLLIAAELGLAAVFIIHIIYAFLVTAQNKQGRASRYKEYKTKGGPSKSNVASRNMIVSGVVLFLFLILHVWQFRFGPSIQEGYTTLLQGEEARDLYRLVQETFQNPLYVIIYTGTMIFLGAHLSHGFWSAFQSLGASNQRTKPILTAVGILLALILAAGFLFIPVWIYFDIPGALK